MVENPDYCKATNAAYKTLIDHNMFDFPTNFFQIIKNMNNISLHTYSELAKRCGYSMDQLFSVVSSNYGFTAKGAISGKCIIYYNEKNYYPVIRFTLAHELGHIVLGHKDDGENENKEANCFARNFLCPVPAIKIFDISTTDEYQDIFNVSKLMAKNSISMIGSDWYYISVENYSDYIEGFENQWHRISPAKIYGIPSGY